MILSTFWCHFFRRSDATCWHFLLVSSSYPASCFALACLLEKSHDADLPRRSRSGKWAEADFRPFCWGKGSIWGRKSCDVSKNPWHPKSQHFRMIASDKIVEGSNRNRPTFHAPSSTAGQQKRVPVLGTRNGARGSIENSTCFQLALATHLSATWPTEPKWQGLVSSYFSWALFAEAKVSNYSPNNTQQNDEMCNGPHDESIHVHLTSPNHISSQANVSLNPCFVETSIWAAQAF